MPLDDAGRMMPPSNNEAEQGLLGALLVSNAAYGRVSEILRPEHFADEVHGRIYAAIAKLIDRGSVANVITLRNLFDQDDALAEIGGGAYLARLAASVVTIINAPHYAAIIRDCWVRREMMRIAEDMHEKAAAPDIDIGGPDLFAEAQAELDGLDQANTTGAGLVPLTDLVDPTLMRVQDAWQNRGRLLGVTTGLIDLDRVLGGLMPGELYVLAGRPGMGKEQPVDMPVLTPEGWVPIGDLRTGHMVIGSDGKPTPVIGIFPRGIRPAYCVTFRDGTSTECGEEHLWSVASAGGRSRLKFSARPLRQLIDGGLLGPKKDGRIGAKWRIPLVGAIQFSQKELPVDPYVLGVLIGDGAMSGHDLRFSNPDMDSDIRNRVAARLPADLRLRENRSGACPYFSISGEGRASLRAAISALELNVKSGEKFIPSIYQFGSVQQRLDLLRGLMDTDGSCLANRVNFYTTAERLAFDLASLVRSLGGVSIIRKYDRSHDDKSTEYCVSVKMAICPFYTARKMAPWRPQEPSRYMRTATFSRDVEQVCISVGAADGLYVTNDFIVTHNSTAAKTIALAAARSGNAVGFFSLEMSAEQLTTWCLADLTGISASRQRRGELDENDLARLTDAGGDLRALRFLIDDTPALSIAQIRARARRLKRKHGLGLIVVDHLGLVTATKEARKQGETASITEITKQLKQLAKELHVPVIALCQLNRGVESRDDKRPGLADLRQSGSIEQDADVVIMCYRAEYYRQKSEPEQRQGENPDKFNSRRADWQEAMDREKGLCDLIIAKHRSGPEAVVKVKFEPEYSRMANLAQWGTN